MTEYIVPYQDAESEFTEKRSRFITHLYKVETEAEARARIEEMKKKYYDARHNCWCYLLQEGGVVRYSDDGEPQGTAGQPMLNVFQRQEVWNVCCVVTRYFGGVLLGAGGLTRAYTKGAADALTAAGIARMGLWTLWDVPCTYPLLERMKLEVAAAGGVVRDAEYGADITLRTAFPAGTAETFQLRLTELSAGAVTFLFVHAINRHLGDDAVISYSIIDYMNTLVVMSMVGIAQGAQPLISYHHGRGDARSARTLLRYSLLSVAVLSAAVFAGSLLGADGIVSLFLGPDLPELREYSAGVFRIFSTSFLLVGYNVVLGGYFTDLERPGEALVISACRSFLTMAAGLVIMIALLGGRGIWWAATLSEAMTGIVSLALLWRWRRKRD